MRCYNCGSFLYESEYCTACGSDVSVFKKIVKKSNEMYNRGLEYARARNLTRAVEYLEISLKMYKKNVNARNLLGLVYVEMGEYAKGLSQWVVSKSVQSDNELADYFLAKMQKSQSDLDRMQSAIKKYNRAVDHVRQESYDLAQVQLKKLLNDDKHFLKGHHLLALLYIKERNLDSAQAVLKKAEKIDRGNPTTISYMSFVENEIKEEERAMSSSEVKSRRKARKALEEENKPLNGDDVIIPTTTYREANPATLTIIQILIGIAIGAAIIFFIVTPARIRTVNTEAAQEAAIYEAQISELEAEIEELDGTSATDMLAEYEALLDAYGAYLDKDYSASLTYLESITKAYDIDGTFLDIYRTILYDESDDEAMVMADNAYSYYIVYGNYRYGISLLEEAQEISPYNEYVLYYMGYCYYNMNDSETALGYLEEYLERYADDGTFAEEAQEIVDAINAAAEETD